MSKRTLLLFSILVIVALIFTVLAFVYSNQTDGLIDDYVAKITVCENITDEQTCYQHDFCEGVYRNTTEGSTAFSSCRRIDDKTQAMLSEQQAMCVQTNGEWMRSHRGFYCQCPASPGKRGVFDKQQGCSIL